MYKIRLATLTDLPRIVEIYNQAIAVGNATADTVPQTVADRLVWSREHMPEQYPIYVCEKPNGEAAGWLSVSVYRPRLTLARTAEVSYYVDYNQHGQGLGSALMQHALADAGRIGKKVFLAILLEGNTGSLRLLENSGSSAGATSRRWPNLQAGYAGSFITAGTFELIWSATASRCTP